MLTAFSSFRYLLSTARSVCLNASATLARLFASLCPPLVLSYLRTFRPVPFPCPKTCATLLLISQLSASPCDCAGSCSWCSQADMKSGWHSAFSYASWVHTLHLHICSSLILPRYQSYSLHTITWLSPSVDWILEWKILISSLLQVSLLGHLYLAWILLSIDTQTIIKMVEL